MHGTMAASYQSLSNPSWLLNMLACHLQESKQPHMKHCIDQQLKLHYRLYEVKYHFHSHILEKIMKMVSLLKIYYCLQKNNCLITV